MAMISVVVCTYNRCATLQRMLSSFFDQPGLADIDHELIVVDNNSHDATRSVVGRYLGRPRVRYVFEPQQGLSVARNRGVAESKGEVVAFLDDDVIVAPRWLQGLALCFLSTDADAVGGRAHLRLEGRRPDWLGPFFRQLLSEVDFGVQRREVPTGTGLWGVNLAFRKTALTGAGRFDERLGRSGGQLLGGEESALLERIAARGGRIVYEPDAMVEHIIGPERLDWTYFSALARSSGRTRRLRDRRCGRLRQALRVAKSALDVAASRARLALHRPLRASPYELQRSRWWHEMQCSYLAMRWKVLTDPAAAR